MKIIKLLLCISFCLVQTAMANAQINPDLVYSKEEADAYFPMYHTFTVEFSDFDSNPNGHIDRYVQHMSLEQRLCVDKVIINIPDRTSWHFMYDGFPNLKEIWFGANSCPGFIMRAFVDHDENYIFRGHSSRAAFTDECKVYLPSDKFPKGLFSLLEQEKKNLFWRSGISPQLLKFRTLLYDGDLYAAYENGGTGCKGYCPGHKFTAKIPAAHTVAQYTTCKSAKRFYYCCAYCGECERNPDHTFVYAKDEIMYAPCTPFGHTYKIRDLSPKNFVGINFKGEKVYMLSCIWCGQNAKEEDLNKTQKDVDLIYGKGNMPIEYYREQFQKAWDGPRKKNALENVTSETRLEPTYFAVPEDDHGAKTSAEAENETRWAMAHNLIDKKVMGADYLQDITRLQMAALAVRVAERLTKQQIKPASARTFTDTANEYALKAAAAGIIMTSDNAFSPDEPISRQEMATYLFRALEYVVKNSDIRYSIYTPDLDSFTDRGEIAQWAVEALGFTHTLGIIKSPSKTSLKPLETCKIEEAVASAERCLYADLMGWYQCIRPSERGYAGSPGGWGKKYCTDYPERDSYLSYVTYDNGDRIWVMDYKMLTGWDSKVGIPDELPFIDTFSGNILYASGQDFLPIKDKYEESPYQDSAQQASAQQKKTEQKQTKQKKEEQKKPAAQQKPKSAKEELIALAKASPNGIVQNMLLAVQMSGDQLTDDEIRQMINTIKAIDASTASNDASAPQDSQKQQASEGYQMSEATKIVKAEAATGNSPYKEVLTKNCYGMLNGHEWVDLGLPSGTRWASCNVGASLPQQPGKLYAWGEVETKASYTDANSKTYNKEIADISGKPEYDVATAKWGKGWRLPTKEEFDELIANCKKYYTIYEGRFGIMYTSKINQQSIFFPAAGWTEGATTHYPKTNGHYMTSTPKEGHLYSLWCWMYSDEIDYMSTGNRSVGQSARPVTD